MLGCPSGCALSPRGREANDRVKPRRVKSLHPESVRVRHVTKSRIYEVLSDRAEQNRAVPAELLANALASRVQSPSDSLVSPRSDDLSPLRKRQLAGLGRPMTDSSWQAREARRRRMKRNASGRFRAANCARARARGHLFRISRDRGISSLLEESAWRITASRVAPSNVTPCKNRDMKSGAGSGSGGS
jgi:hypothetical protein